MLSVLGENFADPVLTQTCRKVRVGLRKVLTSSHHAQYPPLMLDTRGTKIYCIAKKKDGSPCKAFAVNTVAPGVDALCVRHGGVSQGYNLCTCQRLPFHHPPDRVRCGKGLNIVLMVPEDIPAPEAPAPVVTRQPVPVVPPEPPVDPVGAKEARRTALRDRIAALNQERLASYATAHGWRRDYLGEMDRLERELKALDKPPMAEPEPAPKPPEKKIYLDSIYGGGRGVGAARSMGAVERLAQRYEDGTCRFCLKAPGLCRCQSLRPEPGGMTQAQVDRW